MRRFAIAFSASFVSLSLAYADSVAFNKNGPTPLSHNMATQQYTSGSLAPVGNNIYRIHLQCENGQQWRDFHYTMNVIFRGRDGRLVGLWKDNCDLPGRTVGHNKKQSVDDDINLTSIVDKIDKVELYGDRRGSGSIFAIIPKSFQEIVFFPICIGSPQKCREAPSGPIKPANLRQVFIASLRVDCLDDTSQVTKPDHTINMSSYVSQEDALYYLKEFVKESDAAGRDLCQGNGDKTLHEKPGTRRFL